MDLFKGWSYSGTISFNMDHSPIINKTHWGGDALHKSLNQKLIGRNLYTVIKQVTQQCEMCLRNNPNKANKIKLGNISRGNVPGQHWQIDFSELP